MPMIRHLLVFFVNESCHSNNPCCNARPCLFVKYVIESLCFHYLVRQFALRLGILKYLGTKYAMFSPIQIYISLFNSNDSHYLLLSKWLKSGGNGSVWNWKSLLVLAKSLIGTRAWHCWEILLHMSQHINLLVK